jgi:hypothetical protein
MFRKLSTGRREKKRQMPDRKTDFTEGAHGVEARCF